MSKISEAVYIEIIRAAVEVIARAEREPDTLSVIEAACKFLKAHFAVREPMTEEEKQAEYERRRAMMTPKADEPVTVEGQP